MLYNPNKHSLFNQHLIISFISDEFVFLIFMLILIEFNNKKNQKFFLILKTL